MEKCKCENIFKKVPQKCEHRKKGFFGWDVFGGSLFPSLIAQMDWLQSH